MGIVFIPFDGWSPSASYFGEGWGAATNLYQPYLTWRPMRKFASGANSTAFGPMTGAHGHLWMSGVGTSSYTPDDVTLFAGSKSRLFTVTDAGVFADVSRAANYATAVGNEPAGWRFASVGNDIYATNWLDPLQRRTNNSGLFANGVVSIFAPVPRFLAAVREHLVVANLNNAGRYQDEIAWSDADNPTNFDAPTGSSTSIAGSKRLNAVPGQITALLGGQYGLAFKRSSIFYLETTGTTQVFRPDVLSPHVGTSLPSSVINSRYGVFFVGSDGIYRIEGLSAPAKISTPGIDQFLLDSNFGFGFAGSTVREDSRAFGFQAPAMPLVGWIYNLSWGEDGNYLILLYNPVTDKWSTAEINNPRLHVMVNRPYAITPYETVAGFTWDGLASRLATLSPNSTPSTLQMVTLRLRYRPANIDTSEKGQTLVSAVMPLFSKLSSGDTALTPAVSVTPLLDPNAAPGATENALSAIRDAWGWYPFIATGRLFQISITVTAEDFANFEGVYVNQRALQ